MHSERSEKSKIGIRPAGSDFRFLTAFGMTEKKSGMNISLLPSQGQALTLSPRKRGLNILMIM